MKQVLAKRTASGDDKNWNADIVLGLLNAVHEDSSFTQRSAANSLGIALGLANIYLKRCIRKGLVKVKQVPRRRYLYYLTPRGFHEKSRLTAEYLSISLTLFRRARGELDGLLGRCAERGWTRLVFAGVGDLAEVAVLCARSLNIEVLAIFDPASQAEKFSDVPVVRDLPHEDKFDAVLITDFRNAQATYDSLATKILDERLLSLPLLGLVRDKSLSEA